MQPMLDRPTGFDDPYSRDDIIIERPPASPWGAIVAFIVIMAIVVTGLVLLASTTDPATVSTSIAPVTG
ncbi:MAG: hypothetical protein OEM97_00095 [Acidimicrobiia bacterium]|nr:hypothetical protein [Acidimicrobiia bacterium]